MRRGQQKPLNHQPRTDTQSGPCWFVPVGASSFLPLQRRRTSRELIQRRHEAALAALGRVATVATRPATGGHVATTFYLNKKQALFIITKSETATAIAQTNNYSPNVNVNVCLLKVPCPVPRFPVETNLNGPERPSEHSNTPSPVLLVT